MLRSRGSMLLRWYVALLLTLALIASGAFAQEPAATGESTALPPRALRVPPLAWPATEPMPADESFEALIIIGADGLAQVEGCDATPAVCDALSAALIEAEFAPAEQAGTPRAARVRVRFAVVPAPAEPVAPPEPPDAGSAVPTGPALSTPPATAPPESAPSAPSQEFGARAHVKPPPPTAHALELEEMREVPGTFGDPYRVLDALPGVVPVMTGLPYVYVRGAPPAATAYFFDDIQMPALFHLGLGPAVVHPAMVGPIEFYPGVAPARYGRRTGGTVAGQAAYRDLRPGVHGELELRLVDTQLYLAVPFGEGGRFELGGRYGYPGLALKLLEPTAVVQYWDYQVRTRIPVSPRSEVMVVALGSFDLIGSRENGDFERGLELQFHRVELRSITRFARGQLASALTFGYERSGFGEDFDITAVRLGPKLWFDTRIRRARLRVGADLLASAGKIDDPSQADDADAEDAFGDNPIYRSAAGRSVTGAYVELMQPLAARWELEAGLRGDVWITGGDAQAAAEPRLLLRYHPTDQVDLHAAFGLAYQPAVFLIPLPGISDVALDRGLQRAIQSEVGAGLALPASFRLETKFFAHFYDRMLSLDALDSGDIECAPNSDDCNETDSFARMRAYAYGSEVMLRRAFTERLSGWLAYTLSKADGQTDGGRSITPNFDVRHVGNLVLQWRISRGWHVALRGYGQSGRFPLGASGESNPLARRRLPPFFRGDLQLSRLWPRPWGELRFSFDWLNFTFQREPLGWDCVENGDGPTTSERCKVSYVDFPITLPMLGVRGSY